MCHRTTTRQWGLGLPVSLCIIRLYPPVPHVPAKDAWPFHFPLDCSHTVASMNLFNYKIDHGSLRLKPSNEFPFQESQSFYWLAPSAPTCNPPSVDLPLSLSHLVTRFQPLASLHVLKHIKSSCLRAFALSVPFAWNLFPLYLSSSSYSLPTSSQMPLCQRGLPWPQKGSAHALGSPFSLRFTFISGPFHHVTCYVFTC